MRIALKCLVVLTALALAFSLVLSSHYIAPKFQPSAIARLFPRPFAYPGSDPARIPGDQKLLFDPVLVYSTFLGGANAAGSGGASQGAAVLFVDSSGNAYVAGTTSSPNFPVTPGVVQSSSPSGGGFVSKFDPTGQSLLFSTYIPGIYSLRGLAVDPSGNIFVSGDAVSLPIPAGTSPFQSAPKSNTGIGILKLNSTATAVLNATYLDGSGTDALGSIAVDSAGNLYAAGYTTSNDFPTTSGALQTSLGSSAQNGFLTKLNPSLSALVYSTYLGQTSSASVALSGPHGIAVDSSGNAYVTGYASSGFPTTSGAVQPSCVLSSSNSFCAFLAKLNPAGSALTYSTYLAPSGGGSQGYAVAVDGSQNAYVGGETSPGFPEVNSLQSCTSYGGFLSEIDASGNLVFSTCLGGTLLYGILDVAVDGSGNVYAVGDSDSSLPLKNPIQSNPNLVTLPANGPPFVASISPNTNPPALLFSSFIGGAQPNELDVVASVGADSSGNIYAAGTAGAGGGVSGFSQAPAPFPVFNAFQPIPAAGQSCIGCGSSDAFLMKVSPTDAPAAALTPALLSFPPQQVDSSSAPESVTVIDLGSASLTVSNATVTGDFSIQNNCSTVSQAGGTCTIQVTFTPTVTGTRTGTLTITDNSAGSPRTVELTGQGALTTVTVAPSSLTFANQLVGSTSAAQTIAVTNPGPLGLQISHLQASGDFSETNNCGTSLSPTGSCTVNITFTPTATGSRTGTLTITDNAPGSPQTVALSGTGENPSLGLSIASGGSSSGKVTAGSSATYSLSIGGGGMSGTAKLSCTGAPTGAVCNVPATEQVNASTVLNFTASVTTAAPGQVAVRPRGLGNKPWVWAFALFGFIPRVKPRRTVLRVVYLVPLFVVMLCSCGGGSSNTAPQNPGTPAGTYTLTVTATSGNTTQTQNLTLVVQ